MKTLGSLPVGTLIKDANTRYNGEVIIWRVLGHNHDGDGITTLEARDILTLKAFDAKEPNNFNSDRRNYWNNNYKISNILQWLNSDEDNWYQSKHGYDQAPESSYLYYGCNTRIEVTNNALAAAPTWEDATAKFLENRAYDFMNKPTENFAVAVKVTCTKTGTTERIYVNALGFSFS